MDKDHIGHLQGLNNFGLAIADFRCNPHSYSAVESAAVHGVTNTAPPPECPTCSGIFLVRARPDRSLRSNTLPEDFYLG